MLDAQTQEREIEMEENQVLDNQVETGAEEQATGSTFTQEQVMELVQKEADRRVSQALAKQEKKFAAKMAESDKLSKMDSEQKAQYEFETKMREFEEQKREFELERNKVSAMKVLGERGLDVSLVDFIVAEDAEQMLDNINKLDTAIKQIVRREVETRLKGSTPKKDLPLDGTITKEEFKRMSITQQQELYFNNKELYIKLAQ